MPAQNIIEIDFQNPKNVFLALLNEDNTPIDNIDKIYRKLYNAYLATGGKKKSKPTKKDRTATIGMATTEMSKILVEYIFDLMNTPILETANMSMLAGDYLDIMRVLGTDNISEKSLDNVLGFIEKTKNKKIQNIIINLIANKHLNAKSSRAKDAKPVTDMKILMAMATYAPSPIDYLNDPMYQLIKYTASLKRDDISNTIPQILNILEKRTITELKKPEINYSSVDALCLYASDLMRMPVRIPQEMVDDINTRYFHTQMAQQKDQLAYFKTGYKKFISPEKDNKKRTQKSNPFNSYQTVFNTLKTHGDLTKIYDGLLKLANSPNRATQSQINKIMAMAPNKKIKNLVEHICLEINKPLKKSVNSPISAKEYIAIISVMSTKKFDPDATTTTLNTLSNVKNKRAKKEIIDIINFKYNNKKFISDNFSELITAQPNKIPVLPQILIANIEYANDDYLGIRRYIKQLTEYLPQIGTDKIITIYNKIIPVVTKLILAELKTAKNNNEPISRIQLQTYCDFVQTIATYNPMLSKSERDIISTRYAYSNIINADDMHKFFISGYKKMISNSQKQATEKILEPNTGTPAKTSPDDAYDKLVKKTQAFKQDIDKILDEIGNSEASKKVTSLFDEFIKNVKKTLQDTIGTDAYTKLHKAKKTVKDAATKAIDEINNAINKPAAKKSRAEIRKKMESGTRKIVNKIDQGIQRLKQQIQEKQRENQ